MIDFHSHIIPAVDDGSKDIAMSFDMIQASKEESATHICATPHFIPGEFEIIREEYDKKIGELRNYCDPLNIHIISGLEVYINPDLVDLYKRGKIWAINDGVYMLIELPMRDFPIYTERLFYELRLAGVTPILAHPERNLKIMNNPDLLINLIEQGNIAQLNVGSLLGLYGSGVKRSAEKFVEMNLIHLLGSDGHNNTKRTTKLQYGFHYIKKNNPQLYKWILENEKRIIDGNELDILNIKIPRKKFFLFNFLNK
jgi:protein-tyrosine phosphatase